MTKLKLWVLWLLWPSYVKGGNQHSLLVVLKCWFFQKVIRINSHVPWPVHPTSKVIRPEYISRGTRAPGLGICSYIDGRNGITFGENVWLGPRVSVISMNHDTCCYDEYEVVEPITIGRDSLLCVNSVVLPSVRLGPHTIVAAGSVVTKSFPEGNQVLAGVPAIVVKKLGPYWS